MEIIGHFPINRRFLILHGDYSLASTFQKIKYCREIKVNHDLEVI